MTFEVHDGEEHFAMQAFDEWETAFDRAQRLLSMQGGSKIALVLQSEGRMVLRAWEVSEDGVRRLTL